MGTNVSPSGGSNHVVALLNAHGARVGPRCLYHGQVDSPRRHSHPVSGLGALEVRPLGGRTGSCLAEQDSNLVDHDRGSLVGHEYQSSAPRTHGPGHHRGRNCDRGVCDRQTRPRTDLGLDLLGVQGHTDSCRADDWVNSVSNDTLTGFDLQGCGPEGRSHLDSASSPVSFGTLGEGERDCGHRGVRRRDKQSGSRRNRTRNRQFSGHVSPILVCAVQMRTGRTGLGSRRHQSPALTLRRDGAFFLSELPMLPLMRLELGDASIRRNAECSKHDMNQSIS